MHARIDQLLRLRDGEPVDAGLRAHVESCRECAASLGSLQAVRGRLRALPQEPARPGAWESVQSVLAARPVAVDRRALALRFAAIASVASLAVFAAIELSGRIVEPGRPAQAGSLRSALVIGPVDQLRQRSLALEKALAAMPARPAVERAETSLPIDTLEVQVQWLDHKLSLAGVEGNATADSERLWRERVAVMDSLVRLRYVETQRSVL